MANVDNIRIGACKVYYKSVDMGHTKGGVTLTKSPEEVKLTVDQWGETPVDYAVNGEEWTIEARLTEHQLTLLRQLFPTTEEAGANDGRLTFGRNAGFRLRTQAGQLVLHPLANDPTDASEDVVFYKAVPMGEVEVEYTNEDQRVYTVTFVALVETGNADGYWLGHIGDSTD